MNARIGKRFASVALFLFTSMTMVKAVLAQTIPEWQGLQMRAEGEAGAISVWGKPEKKDGFPQNEKIVLEFNTKNGSPVTGSVHIEVLDPMDRCLIHVLDFTIKGKIDHEITEDELELYRERYLPNLNDQKWREKTRLGFLYGQDIEVIHTCKLLDHPSCANAQGSESRDRLLKARQTGKARFENTTIRFDHSITGIIELTGAIDCLTTLFTIQLQAQVVDQAGGLDITARVDDSLENGEQDDQLTPADQAILKMSIRNTLGKPIKGPITARIYCAEEAGKKLAVQFVRQYLEGEWIENRSEDLAPGEEWQFPVPFIVSSERNRWIFEHIIKGDIDKREEEKKPEKELSVPLTQIIWAQVISGDENEKGEVDSRAVQVKKMNGNEDAVIQYPDLIEKAGKPDCQYDDNRDYYRNGDRFYCFPNSEFVRFVALRAARYGGIKEASEQMPEKNHPLMPGFGDEHGSNNKVYLFPEGNIDQVITNIIEYTHRALVPKHHPGPVYDSKIMAMDIYNGLYGPYKTTRNSVFATDEEIAVFEKYQKKGGGGGPRYFPCIANHVLLGSLMRALGIWVREVNIVFHIPYTNFHRQDAASQIYYNGSWHFWAVYWEKPVQDPDQYMEKYYFPAFLYWVGRKSVDTADVDRYLIFTPDIYTSPYWQLYGWMVHNFPHTYFDDVTLSDDSVLPEQVLFPGGPKVPSQKKPLGYQSIRYGFHSPVLGLVELSDNKKIGASAPLDPSEFHRFAMGRGEKPAGLIDEIEGGFYYPEGFYFYQSPSDAASRVQTEQMLIIPFENASEIQDHKITLKATGDGPFEIIAEYMDNDGVSYKASHKGTVKKDDQMAVGGKDLLFEKSGEIKDSGESGAKPLAEHEWTVNVERNHMTDQLITSIRGPVDLKAMSSDYQNKMMQAVKEEILQYVKNIQLDGDVSIGRIMEENQEVADKIMTLIDNQMDLMEKSFIVNEYLIVIPMKLIREALPDQSEGYE